MNYKVINTKTNESLITDETGLNGVIASHCAEMSGLLGALEGALIRQALNAGSWTRKDGKVRIEVTDDAVTHHTVERNGHWMVSQPVRELGEKQVLDVLVVVDGKEKTLRCSLQDLKDGNGWFVAEFAGVPDVAITCMVPVSRMAAPEISKDGHYIEISFGDIELIIKLEDEGVVLDLMDISEGDLIESTYAFYSELSGEAA